MKTADSIVKLNGWRFDLSTYEDRNDFAHTIWHDVFMHYDDIETTEYAMAVANRVESAAKIMWDLHQ